MYLLSQLFSEIANVNENRQEIIQHNITVRNLTSTHSNVKIAVTSEAFAALCQILLHLNQRR